jgi:hypothetical protein
VSAEKLLPVEDVPSLSVEDVRRARAVLEAIVADRAVLADVPEDDRKALLAAAGRASRPTLLDDRRLV